MLRSGIYATKIQRNFFPARNKFEILKRWYGTVIGKELGSIHNSMIQFRSFGIGFWNAPFPCSGILNRTPLVEFSNPTEGGPPIPIDLVINTANGNGKSSRVVIREEALILRPSAHGISTILLN